MLNCESFYNLLVNNNINFFTGVPDSLLKNILCFINEKESTEKHIIAANEGNAIALSTGYYLSTGNPGLVYMQNSGIGNAINPLVSLADNDVYSIPMLLLIGWRGEPGTKDEPQHIKQGKISEDLLKTLDIPFSILPDSLENAEKTIKDAISYINEESAPYALLVRKNTFEEYKSSCSDNNSSTLMNREDAIKLIINQLSDSDIVVSTTGKTSREVFEYREELSQDHNKDFLTVGSMGHCSQIALGIALSKPERKVYCLDGDGAFIMHMGSAAIVGTSKTENFVHIVLNNGAHDSVGGQETAGFKINIAEIAKNCGYGAVFEAKNKNEVTQCLESIKSIQCPILLEIKVNKGSRQNLGRPTTTPIENKKSFMDFIQ